MTTPPGFATTIEVLRLREWLIGAGRPALVLDQFKADGFKFVVDSDSNVHIQSHDGRFYCGWYPQSLRGKEKAGWRRYVTGTAQEPGWDATFHADTPAEVVAVVVAELIAPPRADVPPGRFTLTGTGSSTCCAAAPSPRVQTAHPTTHANRSPLGVLLPPAPLTRAGPPSRTTRQQTHHFFDSTGLRGAEWMADAPQVLIDDLPAAWQFFARVHPVAPPVWTNGYFGTNDDYALKEDVEKTPLRPTPPDEPEGLSRRPYGRALADRHELVALAMTYLSGQATCPDCETVFSVADQVAGTWIP
ncbi:DUF317 domain-containing protein [Streptomyces cinnamoneus]|uniref:DUF317 domain-containing protein n=1 Tax=Streptomyces cinnamoneus TaxID=53446 RepID=A0A918TSX9_STRCJ|nr:DUF317 domain-containing protein [Streptomyces cinnamoneus]GHC57594.1 hypothetical protein GCM10010507_37820 [Streptomyces cinnamoneus]